MSLPVGTLVMVVRNRNHPEMNGKTGEIVGGLRERQYRQNGWNKPHLCYLVRVNGVRGPLPLGRWAASPRCVVPLTPPGTPSDVTRDEPIKEAA